jgi:hypothetical protein
VEGWNSTGGIHSIYEYTDEEYAVKNTQMEMRFEKSEGESQNAPGGEAALTFHVCVA